MKLSDMQIAHVKAMEDERGGLTPAMVVADAKREESPLHGLFDWDQTKAAEAHWIDHAREVIRAVKIVVTTETTTVKAPHYVRDPDADGQGYRSVMALQRDPASARQALIDELTRAAGVVTRARNLALALGLEQEVDVMLQHILGLQMLLRQDEPTAS